MLKDVVSWDIRITTGNSGSRTCLDLCMRECHRRSSLLCLSTGILRRAMSLSMKDSKRTANKRVQATLYSAPDPRRNNKFKTKEILDMKSIVLIFFVCLAMSSLLLTAQTRTEESLIL